MQKHHDERVNSVFLRAIGAMTLAAHDLRALRQESAAAAHSNEQWDDFADHLLSAADAVIEGASGSHFPGNTISVLRDGVHVAVDVDYVDKLSEKLRRHATVGLALGVGESVGLRGEPIPA